MRYALSALIATIVALLLAAGAWGADDAATRLSEKLGHVLLKTSCSPEGQSSSNAPWRCCIRSSTRRR